MDFKERNMSYLCPGEMSVASSADHLAADSPLLDTQDENIQVSRLTQWVQNSSTSSQIDSASGDFLLQTLKHSFINPHSSLFFNSFICILNTNLFISSERFILKFTSNFLLLTGCNRLLLQCVVYSVSFKCIKLFIRLLIVRYVP